MMNKAEVARCGYLHKGIPYLYADAWNIPLPESDVFVLNDMLHYMDNQSRSRY